MKLLFSCYTSVDIPNYEKANIYVTKLEKELSNDDELKIKIVEFYVSWSTHLKMKREGVLQFLMGNKLPLSFYVYVQKFSGKHFVRCYPCERQQSLFDAHIQAFFYFGGVFPVLIYDNLTTAVQKVFMGKKRILQKEYKKFKAYYNFTSRFCNRGQGHEKGGVEGLVGYLFLKKEPSFFFKY